MWGTALSAGVQSCQRVAKTKVFRLKHINPVYLKTSKSTTSTYYGTKKRSGLETQRPSMIGCSSSGPVPITYKDKCGSSFSFTLIIRTSLCVRVKTAGRKNFGG